MDIKKEKLRLLYSEIIKGSSKVFSPLFEKYLYVRHMDNFISSELDLLFQFYFDKATSSNVPSKKDREEAIIKEDLWKKKDADELRDQKNFLQGLQMTKKKLPLKSQIDEINNTIKGVEAKVSELEFKREKLIGPTAEDYATKKINQYFIFSALYSEPEFKERMFSEEVFEELEDEEFIELIRISNVVSDTFTAKTIKRIALCPNFLHGFYLSDDNPLVFYGKPIVQLTFHQLELFGQGRYFKSILNDAGGKAPDDVMDDPDKLVEWFDAKTNAEKLMETASKGTSENMAVSIVGATKEDLKALGYDQEVSNQTNLLAEAKKKGGTLGMQDFLKLSGG